MNPIHREPVMMEGESVFYPFSYFLTAAFNALECGRTDTPGRNFHRVNVVIFSAFAVEGVLNHIGVDKVPDWNDTERKKNWRQKLKDIAKLANVTLDWNKSPVKSVAESFEFRDNMAHGKTWIGDVCYQDGGGAERPSGFPDWLEKFHDLNRIETVNADANALILQLLKGAGYNEHDIFKHGEGAHSQATDGTPPRNNWSLLSPPKSAPKKQPTEQGVYWIVSSLDVKPTPRIAECNGSVFITTIPGNSNVQPSEVSWCSSPFMPPDVGN
jgi:hypothetical protein